VPLIPAQDPVAGKPDIKSAADVQKTREADATLFAEDAAPESKDTRRFERFVVGTHPEQAVEKLNVALTQKPSEAQQTSEMLASGRIPRRELTDKLISLAAAHYTPDAQREFGGFVDKYATTPEDKLVVISSLRAVLNAAPDTDMSVLEQSFRSAGLQLRVGQNPVSGYQLDRKAFDARLTELRAKGKTGPVTLTRADALDLLSRLDTVIDHGDLFWAHWRIARLVETGKIKLADSAVSDLFAGFFRKKLNLVSDSFGTKGAGRIDTKEIGLAICLARRNGFAPDDAAKITDMVGRMKGDVDALFYTRRVFDREMHKAVSAAISPAEAKRLNTLVAQFHAEVDPRLKGQHDRYAIQQNLDRLARAGKINQDTYLAMTSAAVTSRSREEFRRGLRSVQHTLALASLQATMNSVWQEEQKKIEERHEQAREERLQEQREENVIDQKHQDTRRFAEIATEHHIDQFKELAERQRQAPAGEVHEILSVECYLMACEFEAMSGLFTARSKEEVAKLTGRADESKLAQARLARAAPVHR